MRLTKSQRGKYVKDFYQSKYELIKYNQDEFSIYVTGYSSIISIYTVLSVNEYTPFEK